MQFQSQMSQTFITNLMNQETRDKLTSDYGFLNITGQDVSSDVAEMYGIPEVFMSAEPQTVVQQPMPVSRKAISSQNWVTQPLLLFHS